MVFSPEEDGNDHTDVLLTNDLEDLNTSIQSLYNDGKFVDYAFYYIQVICCFIQYINVISFVYRYKYCTAHSLSGFFSDWLH